MGFLNNILRIGKGGEVVEILVPVAFEIPEGNCALLHLKLKNESGVIARVTDVIKRLNLNIVNITTPGIVKGDTGDLFILVENCDKSCGEELLRNVRKDLGKTLIDASVHDSHENFLFVPNSSLMFLGRTSIIIPKILIEKAYKSLYAKQPEAAALSILRNLGVSFGKGLYQEIYTRSFDGKDIESHYDSAIKFLERVYGAMGLGDMSVTYKNGVVFNIEIENNFESLILREIQATRAIPEVTVGIIQGYLSSLTERRVEVHVMETLSKGGHKDVFEVRVYEYSS
ncbi:MAG: hypothetical protein QXF49_07660 [Thermosphaera sp.]